MLQLSLGPFDKPLEVLCLGAHSDDIELGCAGTLLRWMSEYRHVAVTWVVFSAAGARSQEALASAHALLEGAASREVVVGDFADAYLPADYSRAKAFAGELKKRREPDIVMTHRLEDRHQDHRLVAELTWQTWRNQLVLEYEIPKFEGDLGQPNVFVDLPSAIAQRKIDHLMTHFGSQRSKDWFSAETFSSLMRLRGLECRASSGLAEGFHVRKLKL
jgi:LmbE family N-acetylglucosaminyl deacetylase